jgi:hypothetical protein
MTIGCHRQVATHAAPVRSEHEQMANPRVEMDEEEIVHSSDGKLWATVNGP